MLFLAAWRKQWQMTFDAGKRRPPWSSPSRTATASASARAGSSSSWTTNTPTPQSMHVWDCRMAIRLGRCRSVTRVGTPSSIKFLQVANLLNKERKLVEDHFERKLGSWLGVRKILEFYRPIFFWQRRNIVSQNGI